MESTDPIPPPSSSAVTLPSPSPSTSSYQSSDFRLLEISLISARDLFPVTKSMRTYAVTWVHPNRKVTTRVDQHGHTNPTWNDKFAFQVDDEFLLSDKADVTVEIYTASWFRNVIVGTVRVLISNLITPHHYNSGIRRYVALQIRRPSGSPQGILNMGVSLVDTSIGVAPLFGEISPPRMDSGEELDEKLKHMSLQGKSDNNEGDNKQNIHLWRSLSLNSDDVRNEEFPVNSGSACNGSAVNGSELCSDVGPSASIVAEQIAEKSSTKVEVAAASAEGSESCILGELTAEEAAAKGPTGRKEAGSKREEDMKGLRRRHSEAGLFSCFGNAYGFEFTIVCGASNTSPKSGDKKTRKKRPNSKANSA